MTPAEIAEIATAIRVAVERELDGRRGLSWEDIIVDDAETLAEVRKAVEARIAEVLTGAVVTKA